MMDEAELARIEAKPAVFVCNKCRYRGPQGPDHYQWGGFGCSYLADDINAIEKCLCAALRAAWAERDAAVRKLIDADELLLADESTIFQLERKREAAEARVTYMEKTVELFRRTESEYAASLSAAEARERRLLDKIERIGKAIEQPNKNYAIADVSHIVREAPPPDYPPPTEVDDHEADARAHS